MKIFRNNDSSVSIQLESKEEFSRSYVIPFLQYLVTSSANSSSCRLNRNNFSKLLDMIKKSPNTIYKFTQVNAGFIEDIIKQYDYIGHKEDLSRTNNEKILTKEIKVLIQGENNIELRF